MLHIYKFDIYYESFLGSHDEDHICRRCSRQTSPENLSEKDCSTKERADAAFHVILLSKDLMNVLPKIYGIVARYPPLEEVQYNRCSRIKRGSVF